MNIKSISYIKKNASRLADEVAFEPMFVTRNGEQEFVIQSVADYQNQQELIAYMKLVIRSEFDGDSETIKTIDSFLSEV